MSEEKPEQDRPDVPYWEDPVYRYLSRLQREDEASEVLAEQMQSLVDGTMDDGLYAELVAEASAARKQLKQERKAKQKRRPRRAPDGDDTSVQNTAELKKRIFNPRVSKENMIKAIEALPPGERKSTVDGLPPGLKRKLGKYLD